MLAFANYLHWEKHQREFMNINEDKSSEEKPSPQMLENLSSIFQTL